MGVSSNRPAALYICYCDATEPLVQTQVVPYLKELAKRGTDVHLLTFERAPVSGEQRQAILADLAAAGITWHSLRYHARPSLAATLYDIAIGAVVSAYICKNHDIRVVHARSHVPAAMALLLKWMLGFQFLFDMRGLLGEEYADAGRWKRGRVKFKLTQRMERTFFRYADGIVMLTERIKRDLTLIRPELRNRDVDIEVIPCCVDTERFIISQEARFNYRRERGWAGRIVLTYAGKLGGWYLTDEMARFFAIARRDDPRFFFQILTQGDPGAMARALAVQGVRTTDYDIRYEPLSSLPLVLASSDAGISFIKATYSKLASSPTKLGEYLAAGLPAVVTAGVGDCDRLLRDNKVGVILNNCHQAAYRAAARELKALIKEPGIRWRCRTLAEQELSLKRVGGPRYARIYQKLLRLPIAQASTIPYEMAPAGSETGKQIL